MSICIETFTFIHDFTTIGCRGGTKENREVSFRVKLVFLDLVFKSVRDDGSLSEGLQ